MPVKSIKLLFVISGIYDGVLGLAFLLFARGIYAAFGLIPPNHWGYIQFPALLLIVFAIMFFRIAGDPIARREQIIYGIGLKLSYVGVVFWYQLTGGVPALWVPWAWADLVFLTLFVLVWKSLAVKA
jgi:hypothetical protein